MKKVLLIAPLAVISACSQPTVEGDLQTLTTQRDSIKTVVNGLNAQITDLDAAIAELDTTASYDAVTAFEVNPDLFFHYFEVFGKVEADKSINLFPLNSEGGAHPRESGTEGEPGPIIDIPRYRFDGELIERIGNGFGFSSDCVQQTGEVVD